LSADQLDDKKPLVVSGMRIVPSATNRFKRTDAAGVYLEIYAPLLVRASPPFGLELKGVDPKTHEQNDDDGPRQHGGCDATRYLVELERLLAKLLTRET
jgi:hypothetical protein